MAIIVFNIFYSKNLKKEYEIKSENLSKDKLELTEEKDLSSDKFQERNKKFLEKISKIQELEDENLILTSYNFDKGKIIVRGIVRDENYFNEAFKDFHIINKNFYKENGFNKFEMQIK